MIPRWSAASIRVRLTTWYAAVLALMLILYASVTFLAVRHEFQEQFDHQLHDDFESAEGLLAPTPDGQIRWSGERHHDSDDERAYDVWSVTGEQLHRSGTPLAVPPVLAKAANVHGAYESVEANGTHWRTLTAPTVIGGRAVTLRVSRSEERLRGQLSDVLVVLVLGLPVIVALAGVGGYVLAREALAPIDQLGLAARRITADRLHERLSVANERDEIGRLAAVINEMFARLESSFDRLRRFTADASHELRTPLAVIRGIGEAGLAEQRTPAEYREAMGSMLEEVDRVSTLVDTLLRLSHADAGTVRVARTPIDLSELAREAASSLSILADERNQRLRVDAPLSVVASADRLVLREALTNVLDNAIKYSPQGSTIGVSVRSDGNEALISVGDEGPGIPAQHRDRIFDRFFRVDEGRSRHHGGTGLGLAIAKWAVEINDGHISVDEGSSGGSVFHITLPLAGVKTIGPPQTHESVSRVAARK
jgi:heavy metal sensor kinase